MADNPFSITPANPLQALLIGQKSYDAANEAQKARVLDETRAQAGQDFAGGDYKSGLARLLGAGDIQGAHLAAAQLQNQWTQQHAAAQDARSAANDAFSQNLQTKQFGLSERAANRADEDKYAIKEVTDPNTGATSLVRVNTKGAEGPINTGIAPSTPNNPFVVGPKLNTDQSKSATMVDRMNLANGILTKNENINDGTFGYLGGIAAAIPKVRDSVLFNTVASPERQQVVQAQRNFVNAILRVESGAAISQSEFENAQRQYFPQPGDSRTVIEQKRQNRVTAMQGMAREAGPQYKPPTELIAASQPIPAKNPNVPDSAFPPPPQLGEVRGGYRYKGGNPGDPTNWAQAQ